MKNISATYKGLATGGLMIVALIVCYFGLKIPFNSKEQFIALTIYTAGVVWCLIAFKTAAAKGKKV